MISANILHDNHLITNISVSNIDMLVLGIILRQPSDLVIISKWIMIGLRNKVIKPTINQDFDYVYNHAKLANGYLHMS